MRLYVASMMLACTLCGPAMLTSADTATAGPSSSPTVGLPHQPAPADLSARLQELLRRQQELERQIEELRKQLEELRQPKQPPAPPAEPSIEELLEPEIPQESETPRSAVTVGAQAFNPDVAVVGDFAANLGDRPLRLGLARHNTVNRHVELAFSQRISPEAKAVVKFAYGTHGHWHPASAHDEHVHAHQSEQSAGHYELHEGLELEEGYVQFDRLFNRLTLRIGRERLPFMKYNLLDGHELPFVTRPIAISRLFGDHGIIDDGVRLAWLLPTRPYLSLELGVYNGRNAVAFAGTQSNARTLMARLHGYSSWQAGDQEIDWNLGWLHGENVERRCTNIFSADATYQRFHTQFDRFIASLGYLRADVDTPSGSRSRSGAYLHLARRWDRYRMKELGLLVETAESAVPDIFDRWNMYSLYYTWHRTHRVRFRLQFSHLEPEGEPDNDMVFFQTTYVMGTHPPHD